MFLSCLSPTEAYDLLPITGLSFAIVMTTMPDKIEPVLISKQMKNIGDPSNCILMDFLNSEILPLMKLVLS